MSRRHASTRVEGGRARLEDLGSKNGTFCRGERVTSPVVLCDGDEIGLGTISLTMRNLPVDAATLTDGT